MCVKQKQKFKFFIPLPNQLHNSVSNKSEHTDLLYGSHTWVCDQNNETAETYQMCYQLITYKMESQSSVQKKIVY